MAEFRHECDKKRVWLERKDGQRRRAHDFYPTDPQTVRLGLLLAARDGFEPARILDPGAGEGRWGELARQQWPAAHITGVELRDVPQSPVYDRWLTGCFIETAAHLSPAFDLVIGNPPYSHAEAFVRRSLSLLSDGGRLLFLLRAAFHEGQARGRGLWMEHPPCRVSICSTRPSFTGDGKTDATAYAFFTWQKGWKGRTTSETTAPWEEILSRRGRGRPKKYATAADRQAAYRRRLGGS